MPYDPALLQRMRRAIELEEAGVAISMMQELGPPISLGDSFDLLRLLARKADPRFESYATRWLTRFVVERGASLSQCQIATAAIGALAVDPDNENIREALWASLPEQQ
ncbi:MAG: hypothetical protein JSU06_19715 [Actinobacteria bacterium]|nr:hypothetical protein [Actinomycetota bacterium]